VGKKKTTVEYTKATKRKRRSRSDLGRFWQVRYDRFISAGFVDKEANWAANNGLSLRDKQVKKVLKRRREHVGYYMYRWNMSMKEAIKKCAKDLREKLDRRGIDDPNVFYEVSP